MRIDNALRTVEELVDSVSEKVTIEPIKKELHSALDLIYEIWIAIRDAMQSKT